MPHKDKQRPEGALIGAALKRLGISARKAAEQAEMSDARWRHIVNGYQPVGGGQVIDIVGPAETVARMARVVKLTPDDMRATGREDVYSSMIEMEVEESRAAYEEMRADPAFQRALSDDFEADLRAQYAGKESSELEGLASFLIRELSRRAERYDHELQGVREDEGHARSAATPRAEVSSAPDDDPLPTVALDPLLPPEGSDDPAPGHARRESGRA